MNSLRSLRHCITALPPSPLDLAAPELPGAHACGAVDPVCEATFFLVERGNMGAWPSQRHGPVLDAGVDFGIDGAEYRRLQRRAAGDRAVRAHQHDVLIAHY